MQTLHFYIACALKFKNFIITRCHDVIKLATGSLKNKEQDNEKPVGNFITSQSPGSLVPPICKSYIVFMVSILTVSCLPSHPLARNIMNTHGLETVTLIEKQNY